MYRACAPRLVAVLLPLTIAAAAGCDDAIPGQAAGDAGASRADAGPGRLDPGGKGSGDVGARLAPGTVRAGVVTAGAQLLNGIKVEGRKGDFKIYNDRVAFIVAGARATDGYAPYGGEILDAARIGKDGKAEASLLGETILGVGTSLVKPASVGVVKDGRDGEALIRVIGKPVPFGFVTAILPGTKPPEVSVVIDYVLRANSDTLEIRWRVLNPVARTQSLPLSVLGFIGGDGARFYARGYGFDVPGQAGAKEDWVAMVGDRVSYTFYSRDGGLQPLVVYQGVWVLQAPSINLPPRGEKVLRYLLTVGGGTVEAVHAAVRAARKEPPPTLVSGRVVGGGARPIAGVHVHVRKDDATHAHVTMARTDASGRYQVRLAPGRYQLVVYGEGREIGTPVSVVVGKTPVTRDITAPDTATLTFTVADDKGQDLPAKLAFRRAAALPPVPASFGERTYRYGLAYIRFHTGGKGSVALPPGQYTVVASRGYEYEIDTRTVTLAAGGAKTLAFKLTRSVDTRGYMAGDYHVHAMRSPDSNDLDELKAAALAAEGLEIPALTDHEYVSDLNPTIARLGLQKWLYGVIGEELTTVTYGHFNPYPITRDPLKPNGGAMTWLGKTPTQLFADVRKAWPGAVFQINHPRSRGIGGYFSSSSYDPTTGRGDRGVAFDRNFDAVEVFNGSGWRSNRKGTVRDWISFLDRGFKVAAMGNSDSHHAYYAWVGYPRSYIRLSTDEPARLNPAELARAIKAQRVIVSGGPFVTLTAGSRTVGDLVPAKGGKAILRVKVQAPRWVKVDKLELYASNGTPDGRVLYSATLDAKTADPKNPVVRFDRDIPVSVSRDTWVIAVVTAADSARLDPVHPGDRPFGVTNPVYLDVDGNGRYDPPLSF